MKIINMLIIAGSAFVVSCASSSSFSKLSKNTYPAKPANCDIEVLSEEPKRSHEKLGFVTAVSGQTWWAKKSLDAMLPTMKEEACEVGADAIVLKQVEEGGVAWVASTQGKASGLAIRYTTTSEALNQVKPTDSKI